MALVIRQATSNETPDSTQSGAAVTGNTNTGHGDTAVVGVGAGSETKSCRWFGFVAVAGLVTAINLKLSWSESGSIIPVSLSQFQIEYSLNGGGAWNTVINHANVAAPGSGNETVSIPVTQDVSQIQVRDILIATDLGSGQADLTAAVSSIQVEVTVASGGAPLIMGM